MITAVQHAFYRANGYLVLPKMIPTDRIGVYTERFRSILRDWECEKKKMKRARLMRDVTVAKSRAYDERSITKLQDFVDDEVLFGYCHDPGIVNVVKTLVGDDRLIAFHTMFLNKPPDTGMGTSRNPPHQDLWYFPFRPADKIVAAWTALQSIDVQNGGLFVLPGSHTRDLLKHMYPTNPTYPSSPLNKGFHGVTAREDELVHLSMQPGDTVFFHPLLIHGSGVNRSDDCRKAICCHYVSAECETIDVKGTMQEEVAKEIEEMWGRNKCKTFVEIWREKSRTL